MGRQKEVFESVMNKVRIGTYNSNSFNTIVNQLRVE